MLEQYLNQIFDMELFADNITIIDDKGIVRFYKTYNKEAFSFIPKDIVGKHFMDAFDGIDPAESTVLKALKGQPSYDKPEHYRDFKGNIIDTLEDVYPIVLAGRVIGAACVARSLSVKKSGLHLKPLQLAQGGLENMLGETPQMQYVKRMIREIAPTGANVLIYGETGTGKELAAMALHKLSKRNQGHFISQNCAAIPFSLVESTFFGTEKGAYTGAVHRKGILEQANKGTLFLDEVNSLDISVQAKLLKALEEKKFRSLGAEKEVHSDFRTISAINEEPFACIKEGKIRGDLFFRLSSTVIEIPPLRQRKDDIPLLVDYIIAQSSRQMQRQISGITDEAMDSLLSYDWPGNVRELKNAIETGIIFSKDDTIAKEYLPKYILDNRGLQPVRIQLEHDASKSVGAAEPGIAVSKAQEAARTDSTVLKAQEAARTDSAASAAPPVTLIGKSLAEIEKETIRQNLLQCGNHTAVARALGITRQTLIKKIKKYEL